MQAPGDSGVSAPTSVAEESAKPPGPQHRREEVLSNFIRDVGEQGEERLRLQVRAPETQRSRERKDPVETGRSRRDATGSEAAEPAWQQAGLATP